MAAQKGAPPRKACHDYKRPQAPSNQKETFLGPTLCLDIFYTFPLSSKQIFTHKNTHKTNQRLLILLFTKNRRYCPYTQSSFPWFYTLDLGFRGVDVAFWLLSTPLTF